MSITDTKVTCRRMDRIMLVLSIKNSPKRVIAIETITCCSYVNKIVVQTLNCFSSLGGVSFLKTSCCHCKRARYVFICDTPGAFGAPNAIPTAHASSTIISFSICNKNERKALRVVSDAVHEFRV